MLGTEWTEPGKGESICRLLQALTDTPLQHRDVGNASIYLARLGKTRRTGTDHTNIVLTGDPFQVYDLRRIMCCKLTA